MWENDLIPQTVPFSDGLVSVTYPLTADSNPVTVIPGAVVFPRKRVFEDTLRVCEAAYRMLMESGMPEEDARMILPRCVEFRDESSGV